MEKASRPKIIKFYLLILFLLIFAVQCSTQSISGVRYRRVRLHDGVGIVRIAKRYLGTPYRYGGKSPSGFDCSGYSKYVYRRAGYKLPHGARVQYTSLRPVRVPRPGDLVFFKTIGNKVSHVGIYAGGFRFLHSPRTGKNVSYADIRTRYWKKRYAGARTIFLY